MDEKTQRSGVILGIDTGGTFTDGVILDGQSGEILAKTKSSTTKWDLSIGIEKCIEQLKGQRQDLDISLVCLSTTLATNSVVEGKTSRIGLIAMHGGLIQEHYEVDRQYQLSGMIDLYGKVEEEPDENEVLAALADMKGKVDSLVVSGYFSVRNPIHEQRIREMALEHLNVPVVCAHELSTSLGYHERTVTAILNAHLMPVIADLIRKAKKTLRKNNIDANIAVIKGDGAMMDEKQALEHPVETVLSGPAASVVGGACLTGEENALFVDLGGTTMDMAYMKDGKVAVEEEGAVVNGWKTKVRAVDMHTFGLGGDSRLVEADGDFSFGPVKAIPHCYAAMKYPYLLDELPKTKAARLILLDGFHEAEALLLNESRADFENMGETEKKLVKLLSDGPHTIAYIAGKLERKERIFSIGHLVKKGLLEVISITPTDVLHATGEYGQWDVGAARRAIEILAVRRERDTDELIQNLKQLFSDQLTLAIIKSAFAFDHNYDSQVMGSQWLINALFHRGVGTRLQCSLGKNIVAVGAPARAWLLPLAERLDTRITVPENYEVANAIGAAKGKISRRIEVLIRYDDLKGFCRIFTAWGSFERKTMLDAKEYALKLIEERVAQIEEETGIYDYSRNLEERNVYVRSDRKGKLYEILFVMELTATPECFCRRKR